MAGRIGEKVMDERISIWDDGLSSDGMPMPFDYEGVLDSADDSPVQGLKLASISDDTSYLLYAGRWFPVNGYGINRFTATMRITVPAHMIAVGSGSEEVGSAAAPKKPIGGAVTTKTYTFVWNKPSFPGTIIAGQFQDYKSSDAGLDLHVYLKPDHQSLTQTYAETAVKELLEEFLIWSWVVIQFHLLNRSIAVALGILDSCDLLGVLCC